MKITYITHASVLIDLDGFKILTDPWLIGPSWGGSLWHFPMHKFTPKNLPEPDIIYFSHGHDDHFHNETINNFPKSWFNKLIVVANFKEKWWKDAVKSKFKKVKFLNHNQILNIKKDLDLQIFINDGGDIDSSLKIKYKNNSCFFQTDNLMSIKEASRISKLGKIDIAFMMPYLTGIFPAFYKMKKEEMVKLGKIKKGKSLNYSYNLIKNLKPKYLVPYACDIASLGKNFYANFIHNNNKKDFQKFIIKKKLPTESIIMNPGNFIKIDDNGRIKKSVSKYKFNQIEFDKFKRKNSRSFNSFKKNEMKLEKLEREPIVRSFIKTLQIGYRRLKKFNFSVLFLINYKNNEKKSFLINFKKKEIIEDLPEKELYIPKLIIFTEFYKIANLVKKKYPMNFMTFHNGAIICQRNSIDLSKNEKKFWNWIYNLPF